MWVLGPSQEQPPWVVWYPSSDLHPLDVTSEKVVVDFLGGLYFQYTLSPGVSISASCVISF